MTKEQKFFLNALSDHLHNRVTAPPDGLDWHQILQYAKNHQVEGILWHQCKKYLSSNEEYGVIKKLLETAAASNLFFYANNVDAYREIKKVFLENQLRFFAVKGLAVAALYPIPAYRTMGDMDIVMSEDDCNRVQSILEKLGYRVFKDDYELQCYKQDIQLEIHDQLVYKQNKEPSKVKRYFDNCWKYARREENGSFSLDWNFHFIFLIEHTKKHFSGKGVGFRQFMDIAVAVRELTDLNWTIIEADLRRIGLWDYALTALAFCDKWFGIRAPIDTPELDKSFYEDSTDFVFKNGVFGYNHEHHREHAVERQLRISGLPKPLSKVFFMLKGTFIPYKYMINLPYCKFLIGKKYLLPYAWLYRIFYIILMKKNQFVNECRLLLESDDTFKYHERLMTKWGL